MWWFFHRWDGDPPDPPKLKEVLLIGVIAVPVAILLAKGMYWLSVCIADIISPLPF